MTADRPTVLNFPWIAAPATARKLKRDLREAMRDYRNVLVLDLSGRDRLNDKDIDLLLVCLACAAGRDVTVVLVAGSRSVRIILEVTRIASLVPVCDSVDEALKCRVVDGVRSTSETLIQPDTGTNA